MKLITSIFFVLTALSFACSSKNSSNSSKNNPEAEKLINVSGDLSCETVNDLSQSRLIYTNIAKIPQDIRCRVENFANTSNPEASGKVSVASGIAKECSVINLSEKDSEGYQTLSVRLPEVTGQDYCRVMLIVKDAVSGESSPINSITYFYKEDLYEMVASNGDQNEVPESLSEAKFEIINRRTGLTVTDQVLESVSCLNYQAGSSEPVAGCPLDLAPSINGTISGSLAGAGSELYKVHFQGMAGDKVYQTKKPLLVHPGRIQKILTLDRHYDGKVLSSGALYSNFIVSGKCLNFENVELSVTLRDTLGNIKAGPSKFFCTESFFKNMGFPPQFYNDGETYELHIEGGGYHDFISFTLDKTPALASVTNLSANDYIGSPRQPINGTCSEVGQPVKLSYAGKEEFAMCEEGGVWSSILHISSLPDASFDVSVSHQDAAKNAPSSQVISLIKDTSYPVLALATPVNGQIVDSSDMTALEVSGTCTKAGTVTVTHPMGSSQTACVDGEFSLAINVSGLPNGTQRITAYMVDERGHESAPDMRLIVKDDAMPLLAVTSHQNGDAVGANITMSGTCSEVGETVATYLDGQIIARTNCLGDSTFALDLDLSGVVGENYALTFRHYSKALNKNSKLVYLTLEKAPEIAPFVKIFNTNNAFAALRSDGSVEVWGAHNSGGLKALYINTSTTEEDVEIVTALNGDNDVIDISSTQTAFAALHQDGSVTTWGRFTDASAVSSALDGTNKVVKIFSSGSDFAALHEDGSVTTWGRWGFGGISVGTALDGTNDVVEVFATTAAFAALHQDGSVTTWGLNAGDSSSVQPLNNVIKIFGTGNAFAALHQDGSVTTWGLANTGGLKTKYISSMSTEDAEIVAALDGTNDVIDISSTNSAFAALHQDGSVTTWGSVTSGGIKGISDGVNTPTEASYIVDALNGLDPVVKIFSNTAGAFAALHQSGTVTTWGMDTIGGDSNSVIGALHGSNLVTEIFSSSAGFAALHQDGAVTNWGVYSNGTALDGSNPVTKVFTALQAYAALHQDGSVTTWGAPTLGGDSSSVQPLSNVDKIYSNNMAFAIIQSDGSSIVSWGSPNTGGVNGIVSFP